jgi:hypothetical protein
MRKREKYLFFLLICFLLIASPSSIPGHLSSSQLSYLCFARDRSNSSATSRKTEGERNKTQRKLSIKSGDVGLGEEICFTLSSYPTLLRTRIKKTIFQKLSYPSVVLIALMTFSLFHFLLRRLIFSASLSLSSS